MENEQHPDTFQPTENRYSDLEDETFRQENSGMTGAGLPKGFISTDNEPLKHFYLQMSRMMCPSVTADSRETAPEQYPLPSEHFYGKDFGAA